jgi:hypothetical protein
MMTMNTLSDFNQLTFPFSIPASLDITQNSFLSDQPSPLSRRVKQALLCDASINSDELSVLPVNGHGVELAGRVGSRYQKNRAEELAHRIPGVYSVINHLKVQ